MVRGPAVVALGAFALACGSPPQGTARDGGAVPTTDAAIADAAPIDAPLPDLTIDLDRARIEMAIQMREAATCELDPSEACVGGEGMRRLLHFSVETPNIGDGDLILGDPTTSPDFSLSGCHNHYHFNGYADYRLVDGDGGEVAGGRKQAFCLVDTHRYLDEEGVSFAPVYDCSFQGIQRGWSDIYHTRLPCQFIDITDLAPGPYTLEIEINQEGTIAESSTDNNRVEIALDLEDPDLVTPTEPCPVEGPVTHGLRRECGWTLADTFACTPGQAARVGCATGCGLGSCTGDPMIRVCDAARVDGNCSYPAAEAIGESDDFAQNCPCDLSVNCPDSGQIAVYTAAEDPAASYECNLEFEDPFSLAGPPRP